MADLLSVPAIPLQVCLRQFRQNLGRFSPDCLFAWRQRLSLVIFLVED